VANTSTYSGASGETEVKRSDPPREFPYHKDELPCRWKPQGEQRDRTEPVVYTVHHWDGEEWTVALRSLVPGSEAAPQKLFGH
jgi:hypothetical protein